MKDRYLVGLNERYNIKRDSLKTLIAAVGIMYEREIWEHPITKMDVYNKNLKINMYFNYMH